MKSHHSQVFSSIELKICSLSRLWWHFKTSQRISWRHYWWMNRHYRLLEHFKQSLEKMKFF